LINKYLSVSHGAVFFIFCIAANIGLLKIYSDRQIKYGVVQLDKIIGSHVESKGRDVEENDIEKLASRFSLVLEEEIELVSKEYNVILFVKPAVITSLPDYTGLIASRVDERLDE